MLLNQVRALGWHLTPLKRESTQEEGPRALKPDGLAGESLSLDPQEEAVFRFRLTLAERSDDCAARLQKMYTCLRALVDLRDGLVLVGPYHQIKEGGDLALHQTAPP